MAQLMLFLFAMFQCGKAGALVSPVHGASCFRTRARPSTALFGGLFAAPEPPEEAPERGAFARHRDLSPGCAPLGVICAGLDDDMLEAVALTVENVWSAADGDGQISHVPIVALAQAPCSGWRAPFI